MYLSARENKKCLPKKYAFIKSRDQYDTQNHFERLTQNRLLPTCVPSPDTACDLNRETLPNNILGYFEPYQKAGMYKNRYVPPVQLFHHSPSWSRNIVSDTHALQKKP